MKSDEKFPEELHIQRSAGGQYVAYGLGEKYIRADLTRLSEIEKAADGMAEALEQIRTIRRIPWTDLADEIEQRYKDTSHIVDVCVTIAEEALAAYRKLKGETK